MPFAPHFSEEMWSKLGGKGYVSLARWPEFDPSLVVDDVATIGVQVNGKMRGTVELALTATEGEAVTAAMALDTVKSVVGDKTPKKVIYKSGKIINLIV
jgi:leucyl-tRNA synthetase